MPITHMETNFTYRKKLLEHLLSFCTDKRAELFRKVISDRTRHITIVLENIFQAQNASAVLRSCDCFGIQDVHIIENDHPWEVNPDVALGASKWLSIFRYNELENNTAECLSKLKRRGFKLLATLPSSDAVSIYDTDISKPCALLFGTELHGLSPLAIEMADEKVHIPMYGFTESFNISVSAALSLSILTKRLRTGTIFPGLSDEESTEVMLQWARNSVRSSEAIERKFELSYTES
jgi:tRNA (guanosine-2'-O-)-methyltransferase